MMTVTVGDLLDGKFFDIVTGEIAGKDFSTWVDEFNRRRQRQPEIYVVRDGDVVFYVGQSRQVETRLEAHVGRGEFGYSGPSQLGHAILVNLPEARAWTIELWTVEECGETTVDQAEQSLIDKYTPHFNIKGKRKRSSPMPARYIEAAKIANEGVRLE